MQARPLVFSGGVHGRPFPPGLADYLGLIHVAPVHLGSCAECNRATCTMLHAFAINATAQRAKRETTTRGDGGAHNISRGHADDAVGTNGGDCGLAANDEYGRRSRQHFRRISGIHSGYPAQSQGCRKTSLHGNLHARYERSRSISRCARSYSQWPRNATRKSCTVL